jgi:hypothetical protein
MVGAFVVAEVVASVNVMILDVVTALVVIAVVMVVVVVVGATWHSSPVKPLVQLHLQFPVTPIGKPPLMQALPFFPTEHDVAVSQSMPCHPPSQAHVYRLIPSVHEPWLLHDFPAHSLLFVSQSTPENPGSHLQE